MSHFRRERTIVAFQLNAPGQIIPVHDIPQLEWLPFIDAGLTFLPVTFRPSRVKYPPKEQEMAADTAAFSLALIVLAE